MIILLNGPPGSGKDTAAEFITLMVGNSKVHHDKFSRPLKTGLRTIFDFSNSEMKALEAYKEDSNGPEYGDLSWRGMQIEFFLGLEKTYGPSILGRLFVRRNRNNAKLHTVVSDAGRKMEVVPILDANAYGNVGIIKLSRPGCNFDNDIREDLDAMGVKHFEAIHNEFDLELFRAQVRRVLVKWELIDAEFD